MHVGEEEEEEGFGASTHGLEDDDDNDWRQMVPFQMIFFSALESRKELKTSRAASQLSFSPKIVGKTNLHISWEQQEGKRERKKNNLGKPSFSWMLCGSIVVAACGGGIIICGSERDNEFMMCHGQKTAAQSHLLLTPLRRRRRREYRIFFSKKENLRGVIASKIFGGGMKIDRRIFLPLSLTSLNAQMYFQVQSIYGPSHSFFLTPIISWYSIAAASLLQKAFPLSPKQRGGEGEGEEGGKKANRKWVMSTPDRMIVVGRSRVENICTT